MDRSDTDTLLLFTERLNLCHNQLTGTIPRQLRLRKLKYLDIGYNNMTGPLPQEWWRSGQLHRLKNLYVDHNRFTGSLPADFVQIANGRLSSFILSYNLFTGVFPGQWTPNRFIQAVDIRKSGFWAVDRNLCTRNVFAGGEMTTFRSDCAVCPCRDPPYCAPPYCEW